MEPQSVADRVFGEYTRDTPLPATLIGTAGPWSWYYTKVPHDMWVDPTRPPPEPTVEWVPHYW